jgi:signal peptidase I
MSFWKKRKTVSYAKLLLKTTKKLYRKHGKKLAERDAACIESDMAAVRDALRSGNIHEIEKSSEKLRHSFEKHLGFAKKSAFREYAEAFFFALILAIFLRTFIVQLFKIPTGSMEPTLHGAQNYGFGDHIVVNKFIYGPQTLDWVGIPWTNYGFELPSWRFERLALRKPERGDIIVFKFPFNYNCKQCHLDFTLKRGTPRVCPFCGASDVEYQNKDFVKRCVGLPGETLEICDGDVYADGALVTEPKIVKDIYYTNVVAGRGPGRGMYGQKGQKFTVPPDSYFVLGDNSANSKDSRFWGFVPFEEIRGEAIFIYLPPSRIGVVR